jgi:hypothetical protein
MTDLDRDAQYRQAQAERCDDLIDRVAARLRDAAERIERLKGASAYQNRTSRAGSVVHEIHWTVANLRLTSLIECAAEADK